MRVHLLSAYSEPSPGYAVDWLLVHGNPGPHELVDDPAAADLIIFAETFASLDPYFLDVMWHPVFKRFPDKCVLHHNSDGVVTFCRTVSPSVESWQPNQRYRRSFHYVARRRQIQIPALGRLQRAPKYLYSFQGDVATHPVRTQVMALKHREAFLMANSGSLGDKMTKAERDAFHLEYCRTIAESLFVICPRGLGPTSMRLFEVMEMGRVPVIIGDSWKPMSDVPWQECSVQVREADVERIPAMLMARRSDAESMGRRARSVWEHFFSPQHSLVRLIEESAATLAVPHGTLELIRDLSQLGAMRHWHGLTAACVRRARFGRANTF